jgi:hypothetical protein
MVNGYWAGGDIREIRAIRGKRSRSAERILQEGAEEAEAGGRKAESKNRSGEVLLCYLCELL